MNDTPKHDLICANSPSLPPEIDGNPIAEHADLLRRAAESLSDRADIDAVLAWAEGALAASAT